MNHKVALTSRLYNRYATLSVCRRDGTLCWEVAVMLALLFQTLVKHTVDAHVSMMRSATLCWGAFLSTNERTYNHYWLIFSNSLGNCDLAVG